MKFAKSGLVGVGFLLSILTTVSSAPAQAAGSSLIMPLNHVYFVSAGAAPGGDGKSWKSAWNSFGKINWASFRPGDTLQIDGGAQFLNYQESLVVGASGAPGNPIRIVSATEPGHSGQVVINGSRMPGAAGIRFGSQHDVYLQGHRLGAGIYASKSIRVTNFSDAGIWTETASNEIVLQNIEVDHNGGLQRIGVDPPPPGGIQPLAASGVVGGPGGIFSFPTGAGLRLQGRHDICDRLIVHNNGAANIQAVIQNGSLHAVSHCWIYNVDLLVPQPKPLMSATSAFIPVQNIGMNADGIGLTSVSQYPPPPLPMSTFVSPNNFVVSESVLGPNLKNGIAFGARAQLNLSNCLFIDPQLTNLSNGSVGIVGVGQPAAMPPIAYLPAGVTLNNVTSFLPPTNVFNQPHSCLAFAEGPFDSCSRSIFYGGVVDVTGNRLLGKANTQFKTSGNTMVLSSKEVDPKFRTDLSQVRGFYQEVISDYSLKPGSPATGTGSSITSVSKLLRM